MTSNDDDRDDLGLDDDQIGRGLYAFGGWLSEALKGKEGRESFEEGMDRLSGNAPIPEIERALDHGISLGIDISERRRALRDLHERQLHESEAHPRPLVDRTRVENEAGETVGIRVIVSDPDAEVFTHSDAVLVWTSSEDLEEQFEKKIEVPFETFEIIENDPDGVTEFVIRNAALKDNQLGKGERKKVLEKSAEGDVATSVTDQENEDKSREAALDVVRNDPGRGMLVLEETGSRNAKILAGELVRRHPEIDVDDAEQLIAEAAAEIGINSLEEEYDHQFTPVAVEADPPPETEGSEGGTVIEDIADELDADLEDVKDVTDASALADRDLTDSEWSEPDDEDDDDDGGPVEPIEVADEEED